MAEGSFRCRLTGWEELHDIAKNVVAKIRAAKYRPDMIIALARGGLVPARTLSDLLAIKDVAAIKVEHWGITANKDGKAVLKYPIKMDLSGRKILVVDDITDTGESMVIATEFVKSLNPAEVRTATLQHLSGSKYIPDFYGEELTEWTWVVYPWNFMEDMMNLVGKILASANSPLSTEQMIDELFRRHGLKMDRNSLLEVMEHMEYEGRVGIVNQNGDVFWRLVKTE